MNNVLADELAEVLEARLQQDVNVKKGVSNLILISGEKFRVRVTEQSVKFYELKTSEYDYLIGKVEKDNYILLKHDNENKVVIDFFKGTEIKEGESTSEAKCTYLNFDNLIGAIMVLYRL